MKLKPLVNESFSIYKHNESMFLIWGMVKWLIIFFIQWVDNVCFLSTSFQARDKNNKMLEYVMSKNYISNLYLNGVFEICQEVSSDWPSLKQQENVNWNYSFFVHRHMYTDNSIYFQAKINRKHSHSFFRP